MPLGRRVAERGIDLALGDRGFRREPDGRKVGVLVDRDVEDGRDLLQGVPNESRAALAAGLLDLEDRRFHEAERTVVRLRAVPVEIFYCPT